jgi:hypothetical protein
MIFFIQNNGKREPMVSKGHIYTDHTVSIPEFNAIASLPSESLIFGDVIMADYDNGVFVPIPLSIGSLDFAHSAAAMESGEKNIARIQRQLKDIRCAKKVIRKSKGKKLAAHKIPVYLLNYLKLRAKTPRKRIYIVKSENRIPVKLSTPDGSKTYNTVAEGDSKADISIISDNVARRLGLNPIGFLDITGVGGDETINLAQAKIEFMGASFTTDVGILPNLKKAAGSEVLLGNDLIVSKHTPRAK